MADNQTTTLPTWGECQRLKDSGTDLTALQQFIYDNEPALPNDVGWRGQLIAAIDEEKSYAR